MTTSPFSRRAISMIAALAILGFTISLARTANAQDFILRVDIVNGSPTGNGSDWGQDAYQFLQDALAEAASLTQDPEVTVHLWVAAGWDDVNEAWIPYLPTQATGIACPPFFSCDRTASFVLINNVEIYGGFPPDPHTWNDGNGAEFIDRNPFSYITVLDGFAICIGSIRSKAQGKTRNPENRGLRPVRDGA